VDAETRRAIAEYAREVGKLRAEVTTLKRGQRGNQLANSSLEEGQSIEVRDDTGALRGQWGWKDGRVGPVTIGGDPVSAPTAPTVTPSLGGLRVTWDGLLDGDPAIPVDFDHMAVHVSTSSGFTPSAATYVGSIRRAGDGGMLPVVPLPYVPHYVVMVPVTTGGVQGEASAEVAATPLQTSGIDLEADSIEAVHIQAGAVEADKLEAVLVLATTLIAGIPGAARVEIDEDGLRGYNEDNELIFAVDSAGNAVFSGDIVASEITGSRFSIGTAPGPTGAIEAVPNGVVNRVRVGTMQAGLGATADQANFLAASNIGDPSSPLAGFAATATQVIFALDSSGQTADGKPMVRGTATDTTAYLLLRSAANSAAQPSSTLSVTSGDASGTWSSGSGSEVRIRALPDHSSILLTPPPAADPSDTQGSGYIFTQRYASDIAATSVQGPAWASGEGPERGKRAMLHTEGARPERPYTRMTYSGARHMFQQQWNMQTDTRDPADGVVELASTMSFAAARHSPIRDELTTQLTGYSVGTPFYDFPSGTWAAFTFKTSWSGRTRITIALSGLNNASDASSLAVGFRLSTGGTMAASLKRCAFIRSAGAGFGSSQQTMFADTFLLNGNATYTLTPNYRITSGSVAYFDLSLPNHITVEPLL